MIAFGAQVGPEDAISNLSQWIRLLGIEQSPTWLISTKADTVATIIGLILMVGSVAVLFLSVGPKETTSPVKISPDGEFQLHSGIWSNKISLAVRNTTETYFYSVFLKIWTESPGVNSKDISVEPTDNNPHAPLVDIGMGGSTIQIQGDVLIWDFVDSQNRETVHVRFYELRPNETRHLLVSGQAPVKSSAFAKVLKFKTEPDNIMTQPGKVAFMFQPPETGTLKNPRFKTGAVKL